MQTFNILGDDLHPPGCKMLRMLATHALVFAYSPAELKGEETHAVLFTGGSRHENSFSMKGGPQKYSGGGGGGQNPHIIDYAYDKCIGGGKKIIFFPFPKIIEKEIIPPPPQKKTDFQWVMPHHHHPKKTKTIFFYSTGARDSVV